MEKASIAEQASTASPPSYKEATSSAGKDILQPVILVLANQSIHAESDLTVPLYTLSRDIEFLRIESKRGSAKHRLRHIYNLHRQQPTLQLPSSKRAEYFIETVAAPSRRLGHLGLRSRAMAEHWMVLPVDMKGWTALEQPPFIGDTEPVFEVDHRQGASKWTDSEGKDVAMEYDSDSEYRLLVTASLRREMLDALVALWCCRVWERSVDRRR